MSACPCDSCKKREQETAELLTLRRKESAAQAITAWIKDGDRSIVHDGRELLWAVDEDIVREVCGGDFEELATALGLVGEEKP